MPHKPLECIYNLDGLEMSLLHEGFLNALIFYFCEMPSWKMSYSFIVCLWMKRDTYTSNGLERHCLQISRSVENLSTFPENMKMFLWEAEGNSLWFLKASFVSTLVQRQRRVEKCTLCCQVAIEGKLHLCSEIDVFYKALKGINYIASDNDLLTIISYYCWMSLFGSVFYKCMAE